MKKAGVSQEVEITLQSSETSVRISGHLTVPTDCLGIVLFAHGSGSSRLSPRNIQVASALNEAGIGTLLFDLLTPSESENQDNVFDLSLLASRLEGATDWIQHHPVTQKLPIGYFGASTGGGAALWAAADLKEQICAVVSRGGRPDLAIPRLADVIAPTLLIVGGEDTSVIRMNEEANRYLKNGKLVIIRGATHLFEEPGALEEVAEQAQSWFLHYFCLN